MILTILAAQSIFGVASIIILPVILALIARSNSHSKQAAKSSGEAAYGVRPNGSGHASLTQIAEDTLLIVGELKGQIKTIETKVLDNNIKVQEVHDCLDNVSTDVKEIKDKMDEHILHHPGISS